VKFLVMLLHSPASNTHSGVRVYFGATGFSPFNGGVGRNKRARKVQSNQSTIPLNPLS